jgi:hypothetical protein
MITGTIPAAQVSGTAATIGGTNTFAANQIFDGINNTAPNQVGQTPASSTVLVKSQADALYVNKSVSAAPLISYSSYSYNNQTTLIENWTIPVGWTSSTGAVYHHVRGLYTIHANSPSLQIAPFTGYAARNNVYINGNFQGTIINGEFREGSGAINWVVPSMSSWFALWCSGSSSSGLRYRFSSNFAANAGDTITMSPSGHAFIVDQTITDATNWSGFNAGGVFVRQITSAGIPSATDTSLVVNSGSSIATTFTSCSATGTNAMPEAVLFPSTTGWWLWEKTFSGEGYFLINYTE